MLGAERRSAARLLGAVEVASPSRPVARGKFLFHEDQKLYVRGVTYGTFRPGGTWGGYPDPARVARDFRLMAESGINTVRVYEPPPRGLLDLAREHGLWLIVGLPWEQHVAFLDDRDRVRSIEKRVRAGVRACAGHPAVLCYAVGNEIPASIVRWHGRRRSESFLERLYRAAKEEDPAALATYINYPSTEYLDLPFLDLACFNVFLEREEELEAYAARLHNLAGDRPLVLTELGLDSRRNGEEAQAVSLAWQLRTAFRSGCAGAVVFSWTDEWHRGGHDVDDWLFGLTDRERRPKQALAAVRDAFSEVPLPSDLEWPRVSVVVCTHNGAATLYDCLEGVAALDYPSYEAIVVDDGSTDETAAIPERFPVRLIRTPNQGLSAARNTGLAAATGEIVAYIDDDARPDGHWLTYLAASLLTTSHAGVGGPNVTPHGDGAIAEAVARSPGGPVHVLLSDLEAEHIPGCNMAFWRERLIEVGGFDRRFRVAGDDVDVCWRLHERGWTIGFSPAALVWHHRRNSLGAFFRQQRGYGRAEALLETKWPERYNLGGHLRWSGRVYSGTAVQRARRRWRVYYGTWGTGLFQSLYQPAPGLLASLPLIPEWYVLIALLSLASAYELVQEPLSFAVPGLDVPVTLLLLLLAVTTFVVHAAGAGWRSSDRLRVRALTAFLTLVQPLARLSGRLGAGLTPWRRRGGARPAMPWPRTRAIASETWASAPDRLGRVEAALRGEGAALQRGGAFDRWDVHVGVGMLGAARLRLAVEEHGHGWQLVRFRIWPRVSRGGVAAAAVIGMLSALATQRGSLAALVLGITAALLALRLLRECGTAVALCLQVVGREQDWHEREDDIDAVLDQRRAEARARSVQAALETGEGHG